jgi:hypothetical protein
MRRPARPIALLALFPLVASAAAPDPLAKELARRKAYLETSERQDEDWKHLKSAMTPALTSAENALAKGRRLYALGRLAAALPSLSASMYVESRSEGERKSDAAFEAEWTRQGTALASDLKAPSPAALDGVSPAAVRAIAEAAVPQVKNYYDASLEYGRNTMAEAGLYYLGLARAQREVVALCRTVSERSPVPPPPLRRLDAELDALEGEFLAAYRPPASIDKHSDFIAAAAAMKEARELNEAGLLRGALLRYLQSALRLATLRASSPALDAPALEAKVREFVGRLEKQPFDSTIGRYFAEAAVTEGAGATSSAIVDAVFPRYFAALEPAKPAPPRVKPEVTVTLVRWPYT